MRTLPTHKFMLSSLTHTHARDFVCASTKNSTSNNDRGTKNKNSLHKSLHTCSGSVVQLKYRNRLNERKICECFTSVICVHEIERFYFRVNYYFSHTFEISKTEKFTTTAAATAAATTTTQFTFLV